MERKILNLEPGAVFGTRNPMALGRAINAIQWYYSSDGESTYSHSGIILNEQGETYEALWRIRKGDLREYLGQNIIVARYSSLSSFSFKTALMRLMARHHGQFYPVWRLPLHLLGPLSKLISWRGKFVVCSELVAEFLYLAGLRHGQYIGTNPDQLADEWRRWQGWKILGEGILGAENSQFFIDE